MKIIQSRQINLIDSILTKLSYLMLIIVQNNTYKVIILSS